MKLTSHLGVFLLLQTAPSWAGELPFRGPLTIDGVATPFCVAAGDLNGDGKLDLVTVNAGTVVNALLQDPADRTRWTLTSTLLGVSCFFVKTGDFNRDGKDDAVVADPATVAYLLLSRGDGTFETAAKVPSSTGARWVTVGDWDGDQKLDLACANEQPQNVVSLLGDGKGGLALAERHDFAPPHAVEALDFDGDGRLDLLTGGGDGPQGDLLPLRGKGGGRFEPLSALRNVPCHEFIAVGDVDGDGKGDAAVACFDDPPHEGQVWVSRGDGSFEKRLDFNTSQSAEATIADLDGDRRGEVLVADAGSTALLVFREGADGKFGSPAIVGPAGSAPVFLIAADLDRDGHVDGVCANGPKASLTIVWGTAEEPFLGTTKTVSGYRRADGFAVADVDGNGLADFFFAAGSNPEIDVYLNPGCRAWTAPTTIVTPTVDLGTALVAADFDADGVEDLAGVNTLARSIDVVLLGADAKPRSESSYVFDIAPKAIAAGRLDGDGVPDLAAIARSGETLWVLLGDGSGKLGAPRTFTTLGLASSLTVGDIDGDGIGDVAVVGSDNAAVHWGLGGGDVSPLQVLGRSESGGRVSPVIADMDGDQVQDILYGNSTARSLVLLRGQGGRLFAAAGGIPLPDSSIGTIAAADVDLDGRLDATTALVNGGIVVALNLGGAGFAPEVELSTSASGVLGHRVTDLDGDGAPDVALLGRKTSSIICAEPPAGLGKLRRGDADGDGAANIGDAVVILRALFQGGSLACEDAADADDDGHLSLTDAVFELRWLFQGGLEPPSPGASDCGLDPTPDDLSPCRLLCRQ